MKLLSFGKKKTEDDVDPFKGLHQEDRVGYDEEKNIDDNFEKEDQSNNKDNGIEDDIMENNSTIEDEDYIDWDYVEYDYPDLLEHIEEQDWIPISDAGLSQLTHFNTDVIVKKTVKKDTYGSFLEIVCPPGELIVICGFNQSEADENEFFNSPNLYARPHFFTIRCTDVNYNELSPRTIIGITKITRDNKIEKLYQEFYGDLSFTKDDKLKTKKDRYYFAETIMLQAGEKLLLDAYWPKTDISEVELLMVCDRFRNDLQETAFRS